MNTRYTPPEFEKAVKSHIILWKCREANPALKVPPIMVIAGPTGTGKTSGIAHICAQMGAPLYEVQGKDLMASTEGQATSPLVNKLMQAARDPSPLVPCVLVDDADQGGMCTDPNMTGTVNGKAVQGCMMAWADKPDRILVETDNRPPRIARLARPVCMFVTTNRLDHLPVQMLNPSRASVFVLDPQGEELERTVAGIYPQLSLRQAQHLVKRFSGQSVAFFANLKAEIAKEAAMQCADHYSGNLHSADWSLVSDFIAQKSAGADYQVLAAAGEKIAGTSRTTNFLPAASPVKAPARRRSGLNGASHHTNGAHTPSASMKA